VRSNLRYAWLVLLLTSAALVWPACTGEVNRASSRSAGTPARNATASASLPSASASSADPAATAKAEAPDKNPDVIFVPTPQDVVDMMLRLAEVRREDVVYDLGCGDGRVMVTAAKRYGCRAVGYDIDPERVAESRERIRKNGVGKLARVERKDIFTLDLRGATVIFLYLLPELNVRLIPQLEKLPPGCRIVSHDFDMEGVRPDAVLNMTSAEDDDPHEVFLWTTPLKREPKDEKGEDDDKESEDDEDR
jgi:SAM-dependent methyltransferase